MRFGTHFAYGIILEFGHKLLTVGPDHIHERFQELFLVMSATKLIEGSAQGQLLQELEKVSDQVLRVSHLSRHDRFILELDFSNQEIEEALVLLRKVGLAFHIATPHGVQTLIQQTQAYQIVRIIQIKIGRLIARSSYCIEQGLDIAAHEQQAMHKAVLGVAIVLLLQLRAWVR